MVVAVGVDRFWRVGLTAPPGVVIIPVFSASEDPCRVFRPVDCARALWTLTGLSEEVGFLPAMFVGVCRYVRIWEKFEKSER